MSEHSVIAHFDYGTTDLTELFAVEERLEAAIEAAEAGELDGDEVAVDGSDAYIYMYGPDADKLFEAIRPILEATSFTKSAKVTLRYGPPEDGVRVREVVLGA